MTNINLGTVAECATAVFALIGFCVAYMQLHAIKATDDATFVHELYAEFRTDKLGEFLPRFSCGRLKFKVCEDGDYFHGDNNYLISAHDVSFYLLNPLENVGALAARKLVTIDLVYDFFVWYVNLAWGNEEIQKYIMSLKAKNNDWDAFRRLEALYYRCKVYGDEEQLRHDREKLSAPGHHLANWYRALGNRFTHPS